MVRKQKRSEEQKKEKWQSNKYWQKPTNVLVGEFNNCLFYFNGHTITKNCRKTVNENIRVIKLELTVEDYKYLETINYREIYKDKTKKLERPARSYEVNLYGSGGGAALNKPYHYFSGR